MKYLLGLVFCALLGVGNAVYCDEALDCEETECCVATYASQFLGFGWCTLKGRVGSPCNDPDAQLPEAYGGKFLSKCPCRDDTLTCTASVSSGTRLQINASMRCKRDAFSVQKSSDKANKTVEKGASN